eukprot:663386-Pelagomonas_calceolata.AAC.1
MWAEKILPTPMKKKEKHWLRRAANPLHHKAIKSAWLACVCSDEALNNQHWRQWTYFPAARQPWQSWPWPWT